MVATDTKNKSFNTSCNSKVSSSTLEADNITYNVGRRDRGISKKPGRRNSSYLGRSGTPSSILSTDSDIRFTRKFSQQYKSGCCVLATMLLTILLATVLLYLGYRYFKIEPGGEQEFRGMFTVINNGTYQKQFADPSSKAFKTHASQYVKSINDLMYDTRYRFSFISAEILAFDGADGGNLTVFFGLKFNPRWQSIKPEDLETILQKPFLPYKTIDIGSVFVEESTAIKKTPNNNGSPSSSEVISNINFFNGNTTPRKCVHIQLSYCLDNNKSNYTSYPNILGHKNIEDVRNDLISFRELIDAECYKHALEFVCHVLQPVCTTRKMESEDSMLLPCRTFCEEFWLGCGERIPKKLKDMLECSRFPEDSGIGIGCNENFDCKSELERKGQSARICDGILDCADMSDENMCSYCPPQYLHCGIGKRCINITDYCNGEAECSDGSDEKNCLSLMPNTSIVNDLQSTHNPYAFSEGYMTVLENGIISKVCASNLISNKSSKKNVQGAINSIANSLCQSLTFEKSESVKIVPDVGKPENSYVEVEDPFSSEISFTSSTCPSNHVLYITCANIECGKQVTRNDTGVIEGLSKMSLPGDWPWHTVLFKDGVHICDGTLVSSEWILTTVSCFQGQSKSEWIARFGTIRLNSKSPWQQERHIIGMVKSPVEGSTLVMIKLNSPVTFSDFIRPVCLPSPHNFSTSDMQYCNTLGWTKNRETLQRIEVRETTMDSCANISITTANGLCADSIYDINDCDEEELAGSPMVCMTADKKKWILVGVSNWRIACSTIGIQRPRLYDKTSSILKWIQNTISV